MSVWKAYESFSDDEDCSKQSSTSGPAATAFAAFSGANAATALNRSLPPDMNASLRLVHYMDSSMRASIMLIPDSPGVQPYKKASIQVLDEWNRLEKLQSLSPDRNNPAKAAYIAIVMLETLVKVLDAMMKNNQQEMNFLVNRSMRSIAATMESRLHPVAVA